VLGAVLTSDVTGAVVETLEVMIDVETLLSVVV
jgi:hypothetical protein